MQLAYLILPLLGFLVSALNINKDLTTTNPLNPRQIIEANPTVRCCTNCASKYSTSQFQSIFHNLCTWAGGRLTFSSTQTYYSGNYYCPSPTDSSVCAHIELRYLCDFKQQVTYAGCMGYFDFVIDPGTCGGPPFPGAQVASAGGCWVWQATADDLSDFTESDVELGLKCDASGRWCTKPGSNDTVNTYTGTAHAFGQATQM